MAGNNVVVQQARNTVEARTDTWSCTKFNTTRFSHKWTIDNFNYCTEKPGFFMDSGTFPSKHNDGLKWRIRAYPSGINVLSEDYVSVSLHLIKCNRYALNTKFELSIVNDTNVKVNRLVQTATFSPGSTWWAEEFINKYLLLKKRSELLPYDKLTIICDITILENTRKISGTNPTGPFAMTESPIFCQDIGRLYDDPRFSDATVIVDGKNFRVHKVIMAARSPVFWAMFERDMLETRTNQVIIKDLDQRVFVELLRFIYTDKVYNVEALASGLLAASDKYDLKALKIKCAKALYEALNIENAISTIILADLHCANELKTGTMDFICAHTRDVMDTPAFEAMADSYPHLLAEILRAVNRRKDGNADVSVPVADLSGCPPYCLCRLHAGTGFEFPPNGRIVGWIDSPIGLPLNVILDCLSQFFHSDELSTKSLNSLSHFLMIASHEIFTAF